MEKFILNITASSGEFYQGYCESLTLPTGDGVYGVQAGHNPVLVALHMGIAKFTVDGETREVLVGDGIAAQAEHARVLPEQDRTGPRHAAPADGRQIQALNAPLKQNTVSLTQRANGVFVVLLRFNLRSPCCTLL